MWYKVRFAVRSVIASDISSDIFWGHILWAIRYLFSEEKLKEVLSLMEEVELSGSGIICTSLFPEYMGMEFFPALRVPVSESLAIGEGRSKAKKLKKISFIPKKLLDSLRENFSISRYFEQVIQTEDEIREVLPFVSGIMRNAINRKNNRVDAGNLFSTYGISFREGVSLYAYVYVPKDIFSKKEVASVMEYIAETGFGADKSVGYGALRFSEDNDITEIDETIFGDRESSNSFISLSLFSPLEDEVFLKKSFYKTRVKIGRLGESYARKKPFYKRPLWFLEEGSLCRAGEKKFVYGTLFKDVHIDNAICHYSIGVPYWINWVE